MRDWRIWLAALPAAAQGFLLWTDSRMPDPILNDFGAGLALCAAAFGLGWLSIPPKSRWAVEGRGTLAARSACLAAAAAGLWLEWGFLISRLPALSEASLAPAFRPWTRILPSALLVFALAWAAWTIGPLLLRRGAGSAGNPAS